MLRKSLLRFYCTNATVAGVVSATTTASSSQGGGAASSSTVPSGVTYRTLTPGNLLTVIRKEPGEVASYYAVKFFGANTEARVKHLLWADLKRYGHVAMERDTAMVEPPRWYPVQSNPPRAPIVRQYRAEDYDLSFIRDPVMSGSREGELSTTSGGWTPPRPQVAAREVHRSASANAEGWGTVGGRARPSQSRNSFASSSAPQKRVLRGGWEVPVNALPPTNSQATAPHFPPASHGWNQFESDVFGQAGRVTGAPARTVSAPRRATTAATDQSLGQQHDYVVPPSAAPSSYSSPSSQQQQQEEVATTQAETTIAAAAAAAAPTPPQQPSPETVNETKEQLLRLVSKHPKKEAEFYFEKLPSDDHRAVAPLQMKLLRTAGLFEKSKDTQGKTVWSCFDPVDE